MSALASRPVRYLSLYGGAVLLAVAVGAVLAYSEKLGGDNGPFKLLGASLAFAVAVVILLQWRIGAVLLAAATAFESILYPGGPASGMKALAALTFLSFALALLADRQLLERFVKLWRQPLAVAVLVFVLWISASVLWASHRGEALAATATFVGLLGLMVVIGTLDRRYLVLAWAAAVLSAALSVPAGYILPVPEGSDMAVSGRFGPSGAGPNSYACVLEIAFFAAYFGLLRRHKIIAYLLAPVFFYGVFATQSRTALVALVATPLLALCIPRMAGRLGWRLPTMYVLGAAAVAVTILAAPSVGESATERYMTLSQYQSEETWNGRWSVWQGGVEVIASSPLVGVGTGNFSEAAMEYSESVAAHSTRKGEVAGVAHNMFIGVTSQLGVVGLVMFLMILYFLFKAAVPIAQRSALGTGILLGLIVAMIAGMTLSWEDQKVLYLLLGSVLALQPSSAREGVRWAGPCREDFR